MKKVLFLLVPMIFLTVACGGSNQADSDPAADTAADPATETTDIPASEGVDIALVSPENASLPMGDAELLLQVVDPTTGEPIAVEDLQVDLSMKMDGMEPMSTMSVVEPGDEPGQYKVMTNLGMAGMWTMEVQSADSVMPGEATFELEVQ